MDRVAGELARLAVDTRWARSGGRPEGGRSGGTQGMTYEIGGGSPDLGP